MGALPPSSAMGMAREPADAQVCAERRSACRDDESRIHSEFRRSEPGVVRIQAEDFATVTRVAALDTTAGRTVDALASARGSTAVRYARTDQDNAAWTICAAFAEPLAHRTHASTRRRPGSHGRASVRRAGSRTSSRPAPRGNSPSMEGSEVAHGGSAPSRGGLGTRRGDRVRVAGRSSSPCRWRESWPGGTVRGTVGTGERLPRQGRGRRTRWGRRGIEVGIGARASEQRLVSNSPSPTRIRGRRHPWGKRMHAGASNAADSVGRVEAAAKRGRSAHAVAGAASMSPPYRRRRSVVPHPTAIDCVRHALRVRVEEVAR